MLLSAVLEPSTSSVGLGGVVVCEGDGGFAEQEARLPEEGSKRGRSRKSFTKKKAPVSQEAQAGGGPKEPVKMKHEVIGDVVDGLVPGARPSITDVHDDCPKPRNDLFGRQISFASWCAQMVSSVFRTRTPFAAFVRSAIHLSRDPCVSTSPAFPIPLPHCGVFDRMPSGLSLRQRSRIHFKRAVVITILALDFWWSGNRFVDPILLKRSPSASQKQIIKRVVDFMQADGPKIPFEVALAGRRSPQLIARLSELSDALTSAGVRGCPYDRTFEGRDVVVPADNSVLPELEPYRSLDFNRLRVVGEGHFDPSPFLEDDLCMAYLNPDSLLHPGIPDEKDIPCLRDSQQEIVGLMHLWDSRGLLVLHEHDVPSLFPHECVRIFNCYKNVDCDRQIGDRRGRNFCEMRLQGPSKRLPAGPDVFEMFLDVGERIHVSVSDRRDFYHQFRTTYVRAISNTIGPGIPAELVADTAAYSALMIRKANLSSSRHSVGDGLFASHRFPKVSRRKPSMVYGAFGSILQGDHGGVEYACQSHEGLLHSVGLLQDDARVVADRPFRGSSLMQGLVIDDFFAVSKVPSNHVGTTPDEDVIREAIKVYDREKIGGSPSKDLFGERSAKVIGAHINGSDRALSRGICPLGAPSSKRYAIAWITLQLCALAYTTDVLHVCLLGGWVSLLTYRRPLMSILSASFKLVDSSLIDPGSPKIVALPRIVANELTLVALLVCLAVSDLRAPASLKLFSTDASLTKGAICSTDVDKEFSQFLWKVSRSKGAYHRLLTPLQTLSLRLGLTEEVGDDVVVPVSRPLAFCYDFLEIFSGASVVSAAVSALGFVVGPPVDLSICEEYNMEWVHVVSWITFMLASKRLLAIMCEPPCTSFSLMRRPALRSRLCPFGFRVRDRQTYLGNLLMCRSLQILRIALINGASAILETPFSALTRHLPPYKHLLNEPGVSMCRIDSCMYGSIHLKSFRMMGVNLDMSELEVRCSRDHPHVVVEGIYTKASATYTPGLADALARTFAKAIVKFKKDVSDLEKPLVKGLESQVINSLALSADWAVDRTWTFRRNAHINILELSALEKLATMLVQTGSSQRVVSMADSFVVSAAAAKGRTSSVGLAPTLRRYNALCVAGGLFINVPFVPTRLNVADDPTRLVALRSTSGSFDVKAWPLPDLYKLAALPKLRRWCSNWVRFVLSLVGSSALDWSDRSTFRQSRVGSLSSGYLGLDFDSTLGYPGEGPVTLFRLCLLCPSFVCWPWTSVAPFAMVKLAGAVLVPRNVADLARQRRRLQQPPLPKGRPVLETTSLNREELFRAFSTWCTSQGIPIETLLEAALYNVEEINAVLAAYGKALYGAGRPYGHFAETINSLVSQRPVLRRNLQQAWDYAFAWVKAEPPTHHLACPWQVLLAILATAMMWGWPKVAGMCALCFGGILRTGEALNAYRYDLLLPSDTYGTNSYALLAISEPKTRYSAARHQSSKIDSPDLLRVLTLAFGGLSSREKLWPMSGQTLRNRFKAILMALNLSYIHPGMQMLDLASLRPGGATWLLQVTEQSEIVRRRGRWVTTKVMEVYLQEVSAARYLNCLDAAQKEKVFGLAFGFLAILRQAESFVVAKIPSDIWFKVFCWT